MIQTVSRAALPSHLREMSGAPRQIYVRAADETTFAGLMDRPRVAVVGSRMPTPYGRKTTHELASQLAARGIVIVSGLALGIDSIAHRAALEAGGQTMAVLPCSVGQVYPRSHAGLAREILGKGGALVSEYETEVLAFKSNFVARNRIVTGLSDALLITEATEKSGSLHTAGFARDQGIDVFVVPGSIYSPTSVGTNNLAKDSAHTTTDIDDILFHLQLPTLDDEKSARRRIRGANDSEQTLISLMERGISDGHALLTSSDLPVETYNHHMTMMEITGKIRALGANHWSLA